MTDPPILHFITLDVADAGVLRVLVVADDPLVRAGLETLFAALDGFVVAGAVPVDADLAAARAVLRPDVILWDVGYDAGAPVAFDDEEALDGPVVALLPDASCAAEAWAAGARALLLRHSAPSMLATALVGVQQGLVVLDPDLAEAVLALDVRLPAGDLPVDNDLTPREREVLALLAEGLPNKLIADRLGVSEHTVKFHVGTILGKLGVHNRTEAVRHAARRGLLIL